MKCEKSCGIIPLFKNNNQWNTVLVKQNNGVICFPKGHVMPNETEEETALRECFEETNLKARIVEGFREEISYYMPEYDAQKVVVYFLGVIDSLDFSRQECEIEEIFTCSIDDAYSKISFDDTKALLKKAFDYINK